jgi:hypothetical protein
MACLGDQHRLHTCTYHYTTQTALKVEKLASMRGMFGRVVSQCFVASKAGVGAPPRRLDQYCAKYEHVLQLV